MDTKELIEKAKEFCAREYVDTKVCYNQKAHRFYHDESMVKMGLQRCLGVVQFIQSCGVQFEDTEWYENYRERFFEILEENS